jgi:Mn2+/Fe2+ NRAMP family transporter
VMEADNDAGAVSTYTQAGGQYGLHLLWLMLLLLPVCYFIQEMVVRLGIATGKGHAAMIYQRFGKWWGRFSSFDLLLVNFLTLVTEFAAISLATQQMGINPSYSVPIAALLLIIHVTSGSYKRWERITCILCLLDITWFVMAFFSHPATNSVLRHTLIPSVPPGGITTNFAFVVIAIIGTTIAPWQLFFQQSCVADKRLRFTDLKWARLDTLLSACFTATVAGAMIIVGNEAESAPFRVRFLVPRSTSQLYRLDFRTWEDSREGRIFLLHFPARQLPGSVGYWLPRPPSLSWAAPFGSRADQSRPAFGIAQR